MMETVKIVEDGVQATKGTAGLRCHAASAATVSALSEATGGIKQGHFIETA